MTAAVRIIEWLIIALISHPNSKERLIIRREALITMPINHLYPQF